MTSTITRRRFIAITGVAAGMALPPLAAQLRAEEAAGRLHRWTGVALGADASLQLYHPDPAMAARLIAAALAETRRLEKVFSLYDAGSALSRLNRAGRLAAPPQDLVRLLGESERFSRVTGGAFDVTVQPLWTVYAASAATGSEAGPSPASLHRALAEVGHAGIEVAPDLIRFARPGMAVTLNGIAQGYITDRVAELLRDNGIGHTLVDMGESRALGGHPAGRPWRVGLKDPQHDGGILETIPLEDQAIATSGGYGTTFDAEGRFNHIFEPATGGCATRYLSVSVMAPAATTADALSTAFSLMPLDRAPAVLRATGARAAWFVLPDRRIVVQRA